ncbi:MAG: 50S ribosomal protein L17 [Chlorobi bacterium]|nr:50S ribosomal protein L17 [Chlorobiota bacterium]
MRHVKSGRKLKRTESHRRALLRNLAASLIRSDQKAIRTTLAKAKELRPFVERLITKARRAYLRERSGQTPYGTTDLHYRRLVARDIPHEAVLQELFEVVAPVVAERNGGYTRIVKLGFRRGDGAQEAIIQLVDWAAPQDGATSLQRKRRTRTKQQSATATAPEQAPASPEQSAAQAQQESPASNEPVAEASASETAEQSSAAADVAAGDAQQSETEMAPQSDESQQSSQAS